MTTAAWQASEQLGPLSASKSSHTRLGQLFRVASSTSERRILNPFVIIMVSCLTLCPKAFLPQPQRVMSVDEEEP